MQSIQRVASPWVSSPLKPPQGSGSGGATCPQRWSSWTLVGFGRQTLTTTEVQTMTEAITNLQRLLVKSYVLSAPFINRKAFPIGYHGAQVLRSASRYSARLNAVRRDCLLWVKGCLRDDVATRPLYP